MKKLLIGLVFSFFFVGMVSAEAVVVPPQADIETFPIFLEFVPLKFQASHALRVVELTEGWRGLRYSAEQASFEYVELSVGEFVYIDKKDVFRYQAETGARLVEIDPAQCFEEPLRPSRYIEVEELPYSKKVADTETMEDLGGVLDPYQGQVLSEPKKEERPKENKGNWVMGWVIVFVLVFLLLSIVCRF